ncbi:hypothetical protein FGA82_14625 [Pseudomonas fluorescens]|uniref:hypothetical protein n=1 Tax=Pseudomonas fluorescens TaxID=294 RepID=UPI001132815F|nr:hypothetical protein [Pseudomonas fluorescens]TMU78903.1 hypothetical protein FGA82_14625 [Pseudomonas fluorescens]
MSLSAMIFSSTQLTIEDFKEVILSSGGYVSSGMPFRGGISEGDSDIWLALHSKDVVEEFYDADDLQEWKDVLGSVPQVMVEINLDHTEHAKLMYLKVFLNFAKAWSCILYDVDDAVLSCRSVLLKYKACLG